MRTFYSCLVLLFCSTGIQAQEMTIGKLELKKNQVYMIRQGDSAFHLSIDTLIMHRGSRIIAAGKKDLVLTVAFASIDSRCSIAGDDGHNNGTNIDLRINFQDLGNLVINTQGKNFRQGNRNQAIGRGGNVTVHYLHAGLTPQTTSPGHDRYLKVMAEGGKGSADPNSDLYVINSAIRSGSGIAGRPLSNLPQGTVFQGSDGTDGKVHLESVDHL